MAEFGTFLAIRHQYQHLHHEPQSGRILLL
jgi:hypothetical protein